MAWTAPSPLGGEFSIGQIVTAANLILLADDLRYLKGLDGDIYLEDDLGVGTSNVRANTTATYGRILAVSTPNSGENNAILLEGHLSGADTAFGHFAFVNRAATGSDKKAAQMAGLRDTDDNSGQFVLATRNAGALANRVWFKRDGKVGIGQSTPQGLLHGHDGTGGFLHWTATGVAGSAVTVIPDGAGDVVSGLQFMSVTKPSSGNAQSKGTVVGSLIPGGGAISLYTNGADTVDMTIAASGAVTVARTGGSLTYTIALWLIWL